MTFVPTRAQQRLAQLRAATLKARRQRLQVLVLGIVSVLTLVAATGSWMLTSYVNHSIRRVNADTTGTPSSGPINILVAGIDTRGGLTHRQEIELHVGNAISMNSDTLMLVHIPANRDSVEVVSLPRDSWVDLPGHGMNKINAAFGLGGPALMVQTVEQATGLVINDYVEVNFLGFVKVIDALGGVNICLPYAVDDSYSGLHMSAGPHHVDGVTALEFVRDRHSFALSDITRISDQQQLLASLLSEVTTAGVLTNPLRLQQVLSSVAAAITVDKGFNLIQLADELRGIRSSDVTFTTVPLASINYMTPTGESAVLWDKQAADALFTDIRNDTGLPARDSSHGHGTTAASGASTLTRAQVSVDVYNGTMITGLSRRTGKELAALGFTVHKAGLNWTQHNVKQTLIEYPPGHRAAAVLLDAVLPHATMRAVAGLTRIRLVLGTHAYAIAAPAPITVPSTVGAIPSTGQTRSAAQDACQ